MKNKLTIVTLGLILASSLVGGATMAWFTDSEESLENTFEAGTLRLNGDEIKSESIQVDKIEPGDKTDQWDPEHTWTIKNDGTIDGNLSVSIPDIENSGGESGAKLSEIIKINVSIREKGYSVFRTISEFKESGLEDIPLAAQGEEQDEVNLELSWYFPTQDEIDKDINDYQGASTTFDLEFHLEQDRNE